MRRIEDVFAGVEGRGALIAYVMGGDPDKGTCLSVVDTVVEAGADIVEIGIPFSDPIADGPAIQAAGVRSLLSGTRPPDVLEMVRAVKRAHDVPVVLMTYYNPVYSYGVRGFLEAARGKGADGLIVPDLPFEEAKRLGKVAGEEGLDMILLASPTTSPERMKSIAGSTSGFLYLVSVLGVTGTRRRVEKSTVDLIRIAKGSVGKKVPVAVGFGISRPEHVRKVLESGADAAIVGSAIVERVKDIGQGEEETLDELGEFVRSLKAATKMST